MTAAPARAAVGHLVERGGELALQERAVGQAGERVVQRLVAQLVDQLAVLQRDAGVVGHRLQQQDVVLVEGPHVAQPVGRRRARRGCRRRRAAARPRPRGRPARPATGAGRRPGCRAAEQQRLAVGDDLREQPLVLRRSCGSSDRASRPLAPSRTRATSPPSVATKAISARSACSSSFASPSTLPRTSSTSGELVTAWVKR